MAMDFILGPLTSGPPWLYVFLPLILYLVYLWGISYNDLKKKREREAFNLESRRYRAPLPSQVSLWVKLYIPLILRFPKHKTGRASMQGVQG